MRLAVLVGAAGTGKTTVRGPLAGRLGLDAIGPDDFPNRWDDIYWRLDGGRYLLECCQIPRAVRKRLRGDEPIIELVAPVEVRRERLRSQGLPDREVEKRLLQNTDSLGYEEAIVPTLRVDTDRPPEQIVDEIVAAIQVGVG